MRIAFITMMATAPWGGSEALWGETAHRAIEAGHDVFVSIYGWPETPNVVRTLAERGAIIDRRELSKRRRRSAIFNALFYQFKALHEFRPDAILISQGSTYDVSRGKEFKRLRRALLDTQRWPYVLLCHCEQRSPRNQRAVRRAREAFQAARIVGMLSSNLRARSEAHLGTRIENSRIFQNPLNVSAIRPLPWPTGQTLRFAFVGRIEPVKGLDLAIQVFDSPAWRERDWILDIYGSGDSQTDLEDQVRARGLEARIRFPGFCSDIDAVWRDHHALMLPSRAEGVPNSMLEAMLSARPVIVSNVGGIREWVTDSETGYVLPQPDAVSLTDAIERLWRDRGKLEQIGMAAHERTLARRDQDPAGTLLRWLEEIAGR